MQKKWEKTEGYFARFAEQFDFKLELQSLLNII